MQTLRRQDTIYPVVTLSGNYFRMARYGELAFYPRHSVNDLSHGRTHEQTTPQQLIRQLPLLLEILAITPAICSGQSQSPTPLQKLPLLNHLLSLLDLLL
jgi:hypothetical protein